MTIRPLEEKDRDWTKALVAGHFGSSRVVSRGVLHEAGDLPGLVAENGEEPAGLLLYRLEKEQAEVVVVIAVRKRTGAGRALMESFRRHAERLGLRRVWLITTNNNESAQAFYEAMGMLRCAIYPNAVVESRKLKPEIPEYDEDGVPIRDEIEFDWMIGETANGKGSQ